MLITPRPEAHVLLARRSVLRIAARDLRSGLTFAEEDWRLFDVRDAEAYEDGHIDGASRIEPGHVTRCRRFRRDRVNLFYGEDGDADMPYLLAWRLGAAGYPTAVLEDGFAGWLALTASEATTEMAGVFAVLRMPDTAAV